MSELCLVYGMVGIISPFTWNFIWLNLFTGENVNDYFFRVVCLTFEAAVLRELESSPTQTKHIGNDLISKFHLFRSNILFVISMRQIIYCAWLSDNLSSNTVTVSRQMDTPINVCIDQESIQQK